VAHQSFHEPHDVVLPQERRLDIELREFWLAIRAQVFIAEALDDLIVAVETGDHQKLFVDLR